MRDAPPEHAAFVGETGLQCKYQVTEASAVSGYEAIWPEGVALAPGQIQETYLPLPMRRKHWGSLQLGVFITGRPPAWNMRFRDEARRETRAAGGTGTAAKGN